MTPYRTAVVGVPGSWSSEALADAFAARFGERHVVDLSKVALDTEDGRVHTDQLDLTTLDAIFIKKAGPHYGPDLLDRLELLRVAEAKGVLVMSSPERVLRLLDRAACTISLAAAGLPLPPTRITESLELAVDAAVEFGEAVLKPLYSTKARGMEVVSGSRAEIRSRIVAFQEAGNSVLYVQKKIDLPDRDLGVVFLGDSYLGTYARVGHESSWNTTIAAGGRYEAHDPTDATVAVSRRARDLFGLEFTSVDVVETTRGPILFEVSAFGGFRGLHDGLGIDAPARVAAHVEERIRSAKVGVGR
ncbi:MAG: GAK system ATP-grasp enzyme [Candidatus Eisenbacteria bacterium]|uniref:GAK system ATP-grasp enzyme n=1 Tax=Eiseniibacteriota bacterium TaxID=2212470 RepID=A0A956LYX5_UNCEI|nr:GAK system ATP-grasp enzyme [Candidatus Eisenbacteria bacterium]